MFVNGLAKKRGLSNERFNFTNGCQGYVYLAVVVKGKIDEKTRCY